MDTFTRSFFVDHFDSPGAKFIFDSTLKTYTYARLRLAVDDTHVKQYASFYAKQAMTPMGLVKATTGGSSGADNHVALLANALRFVMIRRITNNGNDVSPTLGTIDDGNVRVDLSGSGFDLSNYPNGTDWGSSWPGGTQVTDYPRFYREDDLKRDDEHSSTIDLRGLNNEETSFICLMTGAWKRRSRMRLDYEYPKVIDILFIGSHHEIDQLNSWMGQADLAPKLPTWQTAWSALRNYVRNNPLFDHFSVALYLISGLTYQFWPATPEAAYWMKVEWTVSLLEFRSFRGWNSVLNQLGVTATALGSHRALSEWGYINGRGDINDSLEKINLMALCTAQAMQSGVFCRVYKRSVTPDDDEVYTSAEHFAQHESMFSAAIAEFTQGKVPMSGMKGVYIYPSEDLEEYNEERYVSISAPYGEVDELAHTLGGVYVDKGKKKKKITHGNSIEVAWIPMAGWPMLLVPQDPFKFNSPFTIKGKITPDDGELGRRGFCIPMTKAWEIANLLRMCGYSLKYRSAGEISGPRGFIAPDGIKFSVPDYFKQDKADVNVTLIEQLDDELQQHIPIWNITSMFFKEQSITYDLRVMHCGVSTSLLDERSDIIEFGMGADFTKLATAKHDLRGYISRTPEGFQFTC